MCLSNDFIEKYYGPRTDETHEHPSNSGDAQDKIDEQGKEAGPYVYLPRSSENLLAPERFLVRNTFPITNKD